MRSRKGDPRAGRKWMALRQVVFSQYGDTCHLCGRPGADTVDHLVPVSKGGTNDLGNLRPAHGAKRPYCQGNYSRGNDDRPSTPRGPFSREW